MILRVEMALEFVAAAFGRGVAETRPRRLRQPIRRGLLAGAALLVAIVGGVMWWNNR
jgi:hypothetical protein